MSLVGIEYVWHRQITRGDFFNIERTSVAGPQGGGGQLFIDIPNSVREGLFTMLGLEAPADVNGDWPSGQVNAQVVGHPTESGLLHFGLNRRDDRRYRIQNQNRHTASTERHPAWTAAKGFPEAPDSVQTPEEAGAYIQDGVHIFIVKSLTGDYYAGFTTGTTMPDSWTAGVGSRHYLTQRHLEALLSPPSASIVQDIPLVVYRILDAWKRTTQRVAVWTHRNWQDSRHEHSLAIAGVK